MKHVHRRMEARLVRTPHTCAVETAVYPHGTHFVFPESMLKTMLPVARIFLCGWHLKPQGNIQRNADRPGLILTTAF